MFIFVFQTIWMFIDELAGKGLDLVIIGKFLFYFMPNLVPQVLPLTVLLASIMTFGAFAENYEFAAMKASGISLQRAMKSLIIFIVLLGIGTFFFANNVIPVAEYKSYNLRVNIRKLKPAMAITEGVFTDMGEGSKMNIKVDDKYGDNDRFLKTIVIHKLNDRNENVNVIKAKEGELISNENSSILQLVLKDGTYYEDVPDKDSRKKRHQHTKANFETYTINVDLSELDKKDLEDTKVDNTHKMLNVNELRRKIDTLSEQNREEITKFGENIYKRSGIAYLNRPLKPEKDSTHLETKSAAADTLKIESTEDIINLYDDQQQTQLFEYALNSISKSLEIIKSKKFDLNRRHKMLMLHEIAMNDKFSLALGCIILFFVGAPLGAIIRKGGIGLPMVVAILLFLTYHFIGIFAKNYAEDGSISPALGSWISTLIMLPLGILFTRRATADKSVVSFERLFANKTFISINNFFKSVKNFFIKNKS